ncbi:MAG TPA: hypothetical protein VFE54_10550, partial [Mucilaginibacter sp.]|nr:hypothetical protein [Mucilaginibacter sp.]
MKKPLLSSQNRFISKRLMGKLPVLIFAVLFCFCNDVSAGTRPASLYKNKLIKKGPDYGNTGNGHIGKLIGKSSILSINSLNAPALPTLSYAGPKTYIAG